MLNGLMTANIVLSSIAFVLAVTQVNTLAPWAIGIATINAVVLFIAYTVHQRKLSSPEYMKEVLARMRQFINDESGQSPLPPDGVMVDCDACDLVEHYPQTNDAANSPHLLTHPERCRVFPV